MGKLTNDKGDSTNLWFSALAINLASLTAGTAFAWSSPSIPRLNGLIDPENNPLSTPVTQSESSMIASLIAIGAICSPFIAAQLSDRIGRKRTLLLTLIPMIIGFIFIAVADNVWFFFIARFLSGFAIGGLFATLPNYVAELSENNNRGALSTLFVINITIGNLAIYSMGPFLTIRTAAIICLIPPVLCAIAVTTFVPDSPYYLVAQKDEDGALKALQKLRGTDEVKQELATISKIVEESFLGKSSVLDLFKSHALKKGIIITMGLVTFQQFSGVNAILFYLQTIFEATGSTMRPELSSIIIAIVQFLAAFITPFLVDRLGRRFLLLTSGIGTLLSLTAIGVFFYLKNLNYNIDSIAFLPIFCLVVFIFSYSIGFGPIPFTILGEIFLPRYKAAASTLTIPLCFVFTFCTTVFFPYLMELIGTGESFWFFGVFCAVSLFFIYFYVPETKGKSFTEIQALMNK